MRIVHMASEYPPAQFFGLGRYVEAVSRAQVKRGHEVHVFTNSFGGRDQDAVVDGVNVHRIDFPSPPKPVDGATQVTQFNALLYERVLAWEKRLSPADAVVAHDWLTIIAAEQARRRTGGRLVLTMHDTVIGKTFGKLSNEDKYIAQIERWGCRTADKVIAVSEHVRKELIGAYEAPPERVVVIPCAVDAAWFESVPQELLADLRAALASPEEKLVTYVGRLDPEKGINVLIAAFAEVASRHPQLKLVIAGKGGEKERLSQQASASGLAERTRFLGYVRGAALEALYKVSDVLVCPSTYEPFGIVPLEGMINGLPVIASDVGGMAEIVEHERSGLKVPPSDARALAAALDRVISRPEEAKRFAAAGRERARSVYSWDRVAERTEAVCGSAHRNAPSAPSPSRLKLTAGIRVKNGERFAEECLRDLSEYVDEIVILDDGSTDKTIEICRSFPKVTSVVRWEKDFFHEGIDRNVVLALAKNTNPDWILFPDIDEVFEDRFKREVRTMMEAPDVGVYAFLFCHFWRDRTHYRVDGKWGRETHGFPIPRLVRSQPGLSYPVDKPLGTAQVRGWKGRAIVSDIRVKHYGHLHRDISERKVGLYSALDPSNDYSFMTDETGLQLEEWREAR